MNVHGTETSDTEFLYRVSGVALGNANPLELITEHGYQITLLNSSIERNHRFASPQLFEGSVMRRVEDTAVDVRAPYLTELELLPERSALLSIIP